jgi:hypothetical protein
MHVGRIWLGPAVNNRKVMTFAGASDDAFITSVLALLPDVIPKDVYN